MAKKTIDHNEILEWAKKHEGVPEIIDHPDAKHDEIGIRINFPGPEDDSYFGKDDKTHVKTSWEKFFEVFEEKKLTFVYREEQFEADPSDSYWFDRRE